VNARRRRCARGYLIAADGTCCRHHEGKARCRACGQALDPALTAARIDVHPACPDPDRDDDDPRQQAWFDR